MGRAPGPGPEEREEASEAGDVDARLLPLHLAALVDHDPAADRDGVGADARARETWIVAAIATTSRSTCTPGPRSTDP